MSSQKLGKSLILAGIIIAVIGTIIYLFQEEDEEVKDIKNLIKEADRIIKENI
ncbi:MAG: hypothetical protein QXI58_08750 [Candidatus Micrarchaeia archaeon]